MIAQTISEAIKATIRFKSGLEIRDYLGISKVPGCPRVAVLEYLHGPIMSDNAYRMCFAGYEAERSILDLLTHAGIAQAQSVEVIAPFDNRLRGHTDALTVDGDLIEIKSVTVRRFADIAKSKKALLRHFQQVQLYMRYGGWSQCFVVYRSRETYEHCVVRVPYVVEQAQRMEDKARRILNHIDRKELPHCECGYCK